MKLTLVILFIIPLISLASKDVPKPPASPKVPSSGSVIGGTYKKIFDSCSFSAIEEDKDEENQERECDN